MGGAGGADRTATLGPRPLLHHGRRRRRGGAARQEEGQDEAGSVGGAAASCGEGQGPESLWHDYHDLLQVSLFPGLGRLQSTP
jgi:hypothetical protein